VVREACRLGLPVVAGRAGRPATTEAGWRRARWRFLRRAARRERAVVATAHTADDQVETVALRLLRGAGARGLAGLAAPSPVARPWLGVSRARLAGWVRERAIPHLEDPTNRSLRHARNRLRLELLPALRQVRPSLDGELLAVGRAAARWRQEVEAVVDRLGPRLARPGVLYVARGGLAGYSPEELSVLWPALAARARVRLDRRGTRRLASFTIRGGRVARLPLAGGAEVLALPDRFLVRRRRAAPWPEEELAGVVRWGGWRLRLATAAPDGDPWSAALPAGCRLTVRGWRPGDRIRRSPGDAARRVKRFFADRGVAGPLRAGWPVVLADGEVVWIPGVCRSAAATARPGRPAVLYVCDRAPC
jgi:tRNA(Ile)-lysidine synthase